MKFGWIRSVKLCLNVWGHNTADETHIDAANPRDRAFRRRCLVPAINPARLEKELEAIVELLHDPGEFSRRCLELLRFYGDRTKRTIDTADFELSALNAPAALIRTMATHFQTNVSENPALAQPAASALWQSGYREARILAVAMLGAQVRDEVPGWASEWAKESVDPIVLDELAMQGLVRWRQSSPSAFLSQTSDWLSGKKTHLFGLKAIQAAVQDHQFEDLPSIYRLLRGQSAKVRGESRLVLNELLSELARRSPQETARFLLEEHNREPELAKRVIREVLPAFPRRQKNLLRDALSG